MLRLLALATLAIGSIASAETLNNATILGLVRAGVDEQVIIAKIKTSPNLFDISTDQLIALKKDGVPASLMAAMLAASSGSGVSDNAVLSVDSPDWRAPHPAGVYLMANWLAQPKMVRIDATTANQTKTGGMLGYALTGGIASIKMKSIVPNAAAQAKALQAKPTFYFYFDEAYSSLSSGAKVGSWVTGPATSVTSPAEFSLVRFEAKKARREAQVGSYNMFAGAKSGVMDKDRIPFSFERLAPSVFKVSPDNDLAPGEYGFLYSVTTSSGPAFGGGAGMTARVFDFSVVPR